MRALHTWSLLAGAVACAGIALASPAYGQALVGGTQPARLNSEQKVVFIQSILLIGSAYREWSRAYTSKAAAELVSWMDRHCAPDFVYKGLDGRNESRRAIQARLEKSIPGLRTAAPAVARAERITILKDTATVLVSFRYSDSATDASGKSVSRVGQRFTRDTWAREGQQWRLRRSEELKALPPTPGRAAVPAEHPTQTRR